MYNHTGHCLYICSPDYGEGTGCIVKLRGLPLQLLMTCNHVIPTEDVARNSWIHFDREYTTKEENIIKGEKLFNFEYFKTSPQSVRRLPLHVWHATYHDR